MEADLAKVWILNFQCRKNVQYRVRNVIREGSLMEGDGIGVWSLYQDGTGDNY